MFKAMLQEAAALASLALFVGMIAIWSQVFSNLQVVPRRELRTRVVMAGLKAPSRLKPGMTGKTRQSPV